MFNLEELRKFIQVDSIRALRSCRAVKRHPKNPLLTRKGVLYASVLVFNPGVFKYRGKYVMVFCNDYGSFEEQRLEGTNLGLAFSDDGIDFENLS